MPKTIVVKEEQSLPITNGDPRRLKFSGIQVSMPESGECPFCDWVCTSLKTSTFAMHISRKHPEDTGRPTSRYKCTECGKDDFLARTHLNHHIKNHHEINKLKCRHPECQYEGKNKQSLISHYVCKHMTEIVKECKHAEKCSSCTKTMQSSWAGWKYHIGTCNPNSPFCVRAIECDEE